MRKKLQEYDPVPPPPGVNKFYDFFCGRGEYADKEVADAKWDDIILGAIADQHAIMKAAGDLPPEWEENLKRAQARHAEKVRRLAKKTGG